MHPYIAAKMPRLSRASEMGHFIEVKCQSCRMARLYRPADLMMVLGDLMTIELEHKFRCEKCHSKEYIDVKIVSMIDNLAGRVVRELVEVKTVRRPVWRDKNL